jgi:hypothetical protein
MVAWRTLGVLLACSLFTQPAWARPAAQPGDESPRRARRPPPERLATVTAGLFASYSPYGFPRTNEWLGEIALNLKPDYPNIEIGDVGSDLGFLGYVQALIWEGLGLRLSFQHVKAESPEAFGMTRAEAEATTSPVNLFYSVVNEFNVGPLWIVAGAGVDQYRWRMNWLFHEVGGNRLEDYEWQGRGSGGHALVEVGAAVYGVQFLVGTAYHRGVVEMDLETPPSTTQLVRYPRHYEEDVEEIHLYGGVTLIVF